MPEEIEKTLFKATLVFLVKDGRVLLAKKTRKIGKDKWNGYGGGIEEGETVLQCAVREFKDESGVIIDPADLQKVAEVTFHNTKGDGTKFSCLVHVFLAERWVGEAEESEEMATPTWFPTNQLPVKEMMPADPFWVPLVLMGKKVRGEAHYGPAQAELLQPVKIEEVSGFNQ